MTCSRLVLVLMAALAGCIQGRAPTEPCPIAVIYISVVDSVLVTDSVRYPDCQ